MLDVAIAMLPASAFGVFHFGLHALLVLIVTVAACVLSEYLFQKGMKKPVPSYDCSALVTGMILALNMPPQIPLWIPVSDTHLWRDRCYRKRTAVCRDRRQDQDRYQNRRISVPRIRIIGYKSGENEC